MIKNYLKIAFRNILRHKGYSIINIIGLAVGVVCCLLILIYDLYELGYDKHNKHADNIFRIELENWATVPSAIGPYMESKYSDVKECVRFMHMNRSIVEKDNNVFSEKNFFFADSSVFKVFSFKLISGNAENALAGSNSIVITKDMALKYFGNENPIGKRLMVTTSKQVEFFVTGVVENMPEQSHFKFDFLASASALQLETRPDRNQWTQAISYTYLLLSDGADVPFIEKSLRSEILRRTYSPDTTSLSIYLRPLTKIYLYSDCEKEIEPQGSISYIYILSSIAIFILFLAAINFINLSTAQAVNRTKEIAVRKTLGGDRKKLFAQFLGEAFILVLISTVTALVLVLNISPLFKSITGIEISSHIPLSLLLPMGIVFCLLVTIGAGIYPAIYLSRLEPPAIFKSGIKSGSRVSFIFLRKGLVVFQFTVSILLLIGMLIISNQLDYIQNRKLGLDKEQVLIMPVGNIQAAEYSTLKTELLKHSGISSVTASLNVPAERIIIEGLQPKENPEESQYLRILLAGFDFAETYGIQLEDGRTFSDKFSTDSNGVYLLNKQAAALFNWQNPVGRFLTFPSLMNTGEVVGVVKDFNFSSLHSGIEPLAIFLSTNPRFYKYISVRLGKGEKHSEVEIVERVWKSILPGTPFEYYFLDDSFDNLYRADMRLRSVVTTFTLIGIMIACLGLLGLVSKSTKQRTKGIGIRKVLGASIADILVLLSKEFIALIIIANIIAIPAAYFIMKDWLETFAYKTVISPWLFAATGVIVIIVALLTVSYHTVKASLANPVRSLRYE